MANPAYKYSSDLKAMGDVPELETFDWATPEVISGIEQGIKDAELLKQGLVEEIDPNEFLTKLKEKYK